MVSAKPISRRYFMQTCAGSMALAAVGCRRGKDRSNARSSTVIVGCNDTKDLMIGPSAKYLVFLPLVTYRENGELEGRLAQSWEHSSDYREWTYYLRKDIRWHDGVPVTAHDIKFTMNLEIRPDVGEEAPSLFQSVTVLDDFTLKVRSANTLGYQIDNVYFPRHLLEHLEPKKFYDWDFWRHPVGNGPYRFVRYVPETLMEFEANPDYYRGKPRIQRVLLEFVNSYGRRSLTELLAESVDAISESDSAQIPKLKSDPRFRVYFQYSDWVAQAIYWQNGSYLFRDPCVRQALTLAINRRELLQVLNLPKDVPIMDGPLLGRHLRQGHLPEPSPFDPARAQALLEAAGWHDSDGDGIRELDGRKFHFTAIARADSPFGSMPVYVQDQLRRVGVSMDIQMLEGRLANARRMAGQFEAAFSAIASSAETLQRWFARNSPIGYRNPAVIKLIDEALVTEEPTAQDRIYTDLNKVFRAEVPVTFLFPYILTVFTHRRLRGLNSPWRADPLQYMEDLWLED